MNGINKTGQISRSSPLPAKPIAQTNIAPFWYGIALVFFISVCALSYPVSAYTTPQSAIESEKLYVSGVTFDPGVFFTGDKGTATLYITNGNSNQSVAFNHVTFGDSKEIRLTSGTYDTTANIGPLQTRSFVFSAVTDAPEGSYYPTFSLSFRDADSLYYRTLVQVDNTPLVLTIIDKPDTFTQNKKDLITVQLANPRKNDVKNVILNVSGTGITSTPSKKYIGALPSCNATTVLLSVIPDQETSLKVTATYNNGDNLHASEVTVPILFKSDKKQASPQMSNVKTTLESGVYHITGDITNAGLTTANGVTVTSLSPAIPLDPYKSYIIGSLKADDFGSFEVSFSANSATTIPLQVSYKDTDGNVITSRQDVSISGVSDPGVSTQVGNPLLPFIGLIMVIGVVGWYLYKKQKKNQ